MTSASLPLMLMVLQTATPPDPQMVVANVLIQQIQEAVAKGCAALPDVKGALGAYRYLARQNQRITGEDDLLKYVQAKFELCGELNLENVVTIGGGGGTVKGQKLPPVLVAYSLLAEKDKAVFLETLTRESRAEFGALVETHRTDLQQYQLQLLQQTIKSEYKLDGRSDYTTGLGLGTASKGSKGSSPSSTTSTPSGRPR
jgi:hypothetical protein